MLPSSGTSIMLRAPSLIAFSTAGGHFVRLAVTPADFAAAVADDDHAVEAESAATFDHRGTATDAG